MGRPLGAAVAVAAAVMAIGAAPAFALSQTADAGVWFAKGKVYAMAQSGGTLYIGGTFKKVTSPDGSQSVATQNVAAIDMTSGAALSTFTVTMTNGTASVLVNALGVSPDGSTLYIGGKFDSVDGQPVSNLAAVSTATGDVMTSFTPQASSAVHTILMAPSGSLYIGGSFSRLNGKPRRKLALVNSDGTLDPNWRPVANDVVRTLVYAEDGNTIFVGGIFTTMDSVSRQSVARVTTDTGALDPWTIPAGVINTPQTAWALLPRGNTLYGGFGKGPNYLAAFRLDNGDSGDQRWRLNTVGNVESLAMNAAGTKLFFGGHFGTAVLQQSVCGGTKQLRGLASVNPTTGAIDCTWIPQIEPHGSNFKGAWCMHITSTQLWVGGLMTSISGVPVDGFARFTL